MFWLLALISLFVALLDCRIIRSRLRGRISRRAECLLTAAAVAVDTLPLSWWAFCRLMPDNPVPLVRIGRWVVFAFLLLVVPRAICYSCWMLSRRPVVRAAGIAAAAAFVGLMIWGTTAGRTKFIVNEVTLASPRLPEGFEGFRILQFSDLHVGSLNRPERELERLVGVIASLHPDMVVFSGDMVDVRYTELDSAAMRILGRIEAPCGVWSTIGNHDIGFYIKDSVALPKEESRRLLLARQQSMGWQVPDDETRYIRRNGDSIALTAISFRSEWGKERHAAELPGLDLGPLYEGVPDSLFNLVLAHTPQLREQVTAAGRGDLMLSGHVHSMQIKLRLGRRGISPARILYRRWSGLYETEGRYLYINDGIGSIGFPMRLGAYPEITLITLERP